jgi:hypothetical protein
MLNEECQKSGVEGKTVGLHSEFFQNSAMETHDITTKMMAEIAKIARKWSSSASSAALSLSGSSPGITDLRL